MLPTLNGLGAGVDGTGKKNEARVRWHETGAFPSISRLPSECQFKRGNRAAVRGMSCGLRKDGDGGDVRLNNPLCPVAHRTRNDVIVYRAGKRASPGLGSCSDIVTTSYRRF